MLRLILVALVLAACAPERLNQAEAVNLGGRACIYPIGGWTIVDCSAAAAAQSAKLTAWSRYVFQCRSDAYFATGDEATDEADSSDGYAPAGAWIDFATTDAVRYLSCKNVTSDTDCRYIECQ
jgi:hypothetical protein